MNRSGVLKTHINALPFPYISTGIVSTGPKDLPRRAVFTFGRETQYYIVGNKSENRVKSVAHHSVKGSEDMPDIDLFGVYEKLSDKIDEKYDQLDAKLDSVVNALNGDGGIRERLNRMETAAGKKEKVRLQNRQVWIPFVCAVISAIAAIIAAFL